MQLRYVQTRIRAYLWIAVMATALLNSGHGFAQAAMTTSPASAMGMTSPLAPAGPEGVPLGAVEMNPGGLSPTIPGMTANSTCSGSTMSGASAFDGGGISGMPTNASTSTASGMMDSCSPTSSTTASVGDTGAPSLAASPSSKAAGIPLDSTELNSLGVSPMASLPAPATLPSAVPYSQGQASTGTMGTGCSTSSMGATAGAPTMPGC
jgi:hypothetical protein